MATVAGAKRRNKKVVAAKKGWDATRRKVGLNLGQIWCGWCKPGHWVRAAEWDQHFQQVSFRIAQEREARKRAATKPSPTVRPAERPKNTSKTPRAENAKETAVRTDVLTCTNCGRKQEGSGTTYGCPGCTEGNTKPLKGATPGPNGTWIGTPLAVKEKNVTTSTNGSAPTGSTTAQDAIVAAFRAWAARVPPSIPAARADANAMADCYRQVADVIRSRMRMEMETNNLPESVLEPLQQAATTVSGMGDQHMEVARRLSIRYGEVAEVLARPDTPNADFLKGGR